MPVSERRPFDADHLKVRWVSDEIEAISGFPAAGFIDAAKRTIVTITHPDDREPVDREIRAATAAGRPFALEYRIVHADGGIRWALERGARTVDRHGVEWLDGIHPAVLADRGLVTAVRASTHLHWRGWRRRARAAPRSRATRLRPSQGGRGSVPSSWARCPRVTSRSSRSCCARPASPWSAS